MARTRILIVEDESLIADDLSDALGGLGYEVVGIESSGQGAIMAARTSSPDIVLMDIVLEGDINGIEAARTIRMELGIPVVFLTAYATESILESIGDIDPFGYLIKPFENRELRFTIQMALYKKRTEDELKRINKTLKTMNECGTALMHASDEQTLLGDLCRIVVEHGDYDFAWVCYRDEESSGAIIPMAMAGEDNGYIASLGASPSIDEMLGPTAAVLRSGMPIALNQSETSVSLSPYNKLGFGSALALPVTVDRAPVGALTLLCSSPSRFEQAEFDLLVELSNSLSHWLTSLRSRKAQVKAEEAKDAINTVTQLLLSAGDIHTTFGQLPEELSKKIHFPFVAIDINSNASDDGEYAGRYESITAGSVFPDTLPPMPEDGSPLLLQKIQQSDDPSLAALKALGADVYISVPVMTRSATYGQIAVADTAHRDIQHKSVTLQLIANQLAQQIERRRDALAIQRSHERFMAVMDSLDAVVYVADMHTGELLFANKYLREHFGGGEPIGARCWDVLQEGKNSPCDFCTNQFLIDADGNPTGVHQWEQFNKKTGRWLDVHDRAIRWVDEKLVRLTVATDITDRKADEDELRQHRERLASLVDERTAELRDANLSLQREMVERKRAEEELLKAQRLESMAIVAGGLAHDFNNILTSILSSISLAKLSTDSGSDVHRRMVTAEKAALRARDLTQQLLTFSKSGSPVKTTASISDLISDSSEFALRGSNVRCINRFADDLWHVDIDEGQISQVINNLIINASQAMPKGGSIAISAENATLKAGEVPPLPAGRYVKVSVRDQGTGISEANLPHIFDPYFTTKPGGSGLGLASTYSIIKKHDGHIVARSAEGDGATFTFFLPATDSKAIPAKPAAQKVMHGTGRLLVMDDDMGIRESLGEALKFLGYEVSFAEDGEACIEQYKQALREGKRFDVVVMDLTIPGGMGGMEAMARLRELDMFVKAVVSSGYSNDPVMSDHKKFGFAAMISKPYRIEELSRVIHAVLNGQA